MNNYNQNYTYAYKRKKRLIRLLFILPTSIKTLDICHYSLRIRVSRILMLLHLEKSQCDLLFSLLPIKIESL